MREHQGLARSVPEPDDQAVRPRWGQNPRWSRRSPTARRSRSSRQSSPTRPGCGRRRGMFGPTVKPAHRSTTSTRSTPKTAPRRHRVVDYVVGAAPSPGVFVLGMHEHPAEALLDLYKLGNGPLYCFYTPYHLCHFEVPTTVARAVLLGDATIAAREPTVEVVTTAKVDLEPGDHRRDRRVPDLRPVRERGHGGRGDLLPLGVAQECRLIRAVPKDSVLTYEDVEFPPGRVCDALRQETECPLRQHPSPGAVVISACNIVSADVGHCCARLGEPSRPHGRSASAVDRRRRRFSGRLSRPDVA